MQDQNKKDGENQSKGNKNQSYFKKRHNNKNKKQNNYNRNNNNDSRPNNNNRNPQSDERQENNDNKNQQNSNNRSNYKKNSNRYNKNRKNTNNNYKRRRDNNNNTRKEKRNNYQEVREKVILGKCFLCNSNVSDEIYAVKEGDYYIHFECMTKEVKKRMREQLPDLRNYKVYYLGSGNFAAVNEKNSKGNITWEIILKINSKELILEKLKQEEDTDSNS